MLDLRLAVSWSTRPLNEAGNEAQGEGDQSARAHPGLWTEPANAREIRTHHTTAQS